MLQARAFTNASSEWETTILTWVAPATGWIDVDYLVTAADIHDPDRSVVVALDHWDGTTLTELASPGAYTGTLFESSPNLSEPNSWNATVTGLTVNAGDQIQLWIAQGPWTNATVELSGTLTFYVPEPASGLLLGLCGLLALRRRRLN